MPASGQYTALTLGQAIQLLAERLSDPTQVRWTGAELQGYLQWALQTWNALTSTYKDTCSFNTADPALNTNTPFFDLATVAPALRGLTVTTDRAITLLCYHLLEAQPTGSAWAGTTQFSYTDLRGALERRRDQFLLETAALCTRATIPIAPPPDGRVSLPETVVTTRRLAWKTPTESITVVQRDDEWSANSYVQTWPQNPTQIPRVFSQAVQRPLYLQLIPPPSDSGTLDLCTVNRGAVLGPDVLLGVPDDWAWVVVFGALADLLSRDGFAFDPGRAQYAEARWQHGLTLAALAPVVLTGRIDNRVVRVGALPDLDQFQRAWQTLPGTPRTIVTLGQNLVIVAPVPTTNTPSGWGITLDVVRNAPVPVSAGQYLPIGPELVDTLLDYAQHLAILKEGATQVQAAQPLLDRFFRAAGVEIAWQQALTLQRKALHGQTSQDRRGASPTLRSELQDAATTPGAVM